MTLPFKNIQNLSKIADTLMGENSTFPGPSRPQLSKTSINKIMKEIIFLS